MTIFLLSYMQISPKVETMTPKSFSVRIYLQDGHVAGVKVVSKSKWSGRGLVIPRTSFLTEKARTELNAPGIYLLVGPTNEGDRVSIHVGAADPICHDLAEHYTKMDFWDEALVFASKDNTLNPIHIQYLEARLIQLAQDANRVKLSNQNIPQLPRLSADELIYAEAFLGHILSLCPLLGLSAFEPTSPDK
jgi:hypothetical protein